MICASEKTEMEFPRTVVLDGGTRIILQDYNTGFCLLVNTEQQISSRETARSHQNLEDHKKYQIPKESLILENCTKYIFRDPNLGWLLCDFDSIHENFPICLPEITDFVMSPSLKVLVWRQAKEYRISHLKSKDLHKQYDQSILIESRE